MKQEGGSSFESICMLLNPHPKCTRSVHAPSSQSQSAQIVVLDDDPVHRPTSEYAHGVAALQCRANLINPRGTRRSNTPSFNN